MIIVDSKTPTNAKIVLGFICCFKLFQFVCKAPAKSKKPNRNLSTILSILASSM